MERIKKIEQDILSNSFTNKDCLLETVSKGNIYRYAPHQRIYEVMSDLVMTSSEISSSTVMAVLPEINISVFTDILTSQATGREHNTLLKNLALDFNRELAYQLVKNYTLQYADKKDNLELLISQLENLRSGNDIDIFEDFKSLPETIAETFNADSYLTTGIPPLDSVIIGFTSTDLITIAGMPGGGKTTLALQIAFENIGSLFMTYEMSIKREIYAKALSYFSGVDSMRIINPKVNINLTMDELDKLEIAKKQIDKLHLRMSEKPVKFHTLISAVKREVAKEKPPLILVDYVQLIDGDGKTQENKITMMTSSLKRLAKVLNIPIIILSQFTKEGYKDGKRPTMADLRGSGSIAQDSNIILICHEGNVYVEKSRMTIVGMVYNLTMNKPLNRFEYGYNWDNLVEPTG